MSTTSQTPDELLGHEIGAGDFASPEAAAASGQMEIRARGYWEQVWIRFKRDKVAVASGVLIILIGRASCRERVSIDV